MKQTPVEGVGRYSQVTIVRCESWGASDKFYILVDKNNHQIGQSWSKLVNARKRARKIVDYKGDVAAA